MLQKCHLIKPFVLLVFISIFLVSCAKDKEKNNDITPKDNDSVFKNKEWLPRMDDRITKEAEEGKGLFGKSGIIGGDKKSGGSMTFANTNLMWKASLKALEEIPLIQVDYAGGMIITDWYGIEESEKKEQIKITVKFTSDEISSTSFNVITHKRICINNNCSTELGKSSFNESIKEAIVASARSLSIEEQKLKK